MLRDRFMQQGSFGDVARQVVRAEGGGQYRIDGLTLSTHFQPIYCAQRGIAVGDEALARPREAFEALDRDALVRLDWTCRALHLRNYAVVDPGDRRLFLNVYPAALVDDGDGGRSFAELVRFYGLSPDRVVLEILESDCGDESTLAEAALAHRAHGFVIAMEDFGNGRSNFDRIVALRPKIVKMDGAMLRGALGEAQSRRMLPTMVRMLRDTGADIAVKGIDSANAAIDAIEAGASFLQGYHLGAPSRVMQDENLARELIESAQRLAAA
jgi:EAL domain-containing protein (putative c-di-GMP-specific phosphodiesterase class I)